jgi:peptidoglycan/LPS O-acetylase OafA/YrhL
MSAACIEPSRIPQVDVLRGLAALGVFGFHAANVLGFPKRTMPPIEAFGRTWDAIPSLFSLGATGVSLFFVVSGFCLALQPLRRGQARIAPAGYFRDRAARILPAYVLAVLFSAAVASALDVDWTGAQLATFLLLLQGLVQEWVFLFNGALWSMSTEVQFYLVFPLLFAWLARGRPAFLATVLALTLLSRLAFATMPGAGIEAGGISRSALLMNTLPGRLFEFGLGMALARALLADRDGLRRVARAVVLPAVMFGSWAKGYGPDWLGDPAVGLAFAAIVGCAVTGPPGDTDGYAARFGRASYSFFLLHFPILAWLGAMSPWLFALDPYLAFACLAAMGLAATVPLSVALYRGVELPAWRAWRRPRAAAAIP